MAQVLQGLLPAVIDVGYTEVGLMAPGGPKESYSRANHLLRNHDCSPFQVQEPEFFRRPVAGSSGPLLSRVQLSVYLLETSRSNLAPKYVVPDHSIGP